LTVRVNGSKIRLFQHQSAKRLDEGTKRTSLFQYKIKMVQFNLEFICTPAVTTKD
jgi:hypothetical protein